MSSRSLLESIHIVCELHFMWIPLRNILGEDTLLQVPIRSGIFRVKENKVSSADNFRFIHHRYISTLAQKRLFIMNFVFLKLTVVEEKKKQIIH